MIVAPSFHFGGEFVVARFHGRWLYLHNWMNTSVNRPLTIEHMAMLVDFIMLAKQVSPT